MNELVPLILLLALGGRSKCGPASAPWPSTAAPPPPPPPPPPPIAPDATSNMTEPSSAAPAASEQPSAAPPSDTPTEALKGFVKARNKLYKSVAKRASDLVSPKPKAKPSPKAKPASFVPRSPLPRALDFNPEMDVSVANIQSALIKRGAKIKKDGVYGPLTAAAWQAAARKRGLSGAIVKLTPKIARVATKTFTTLSAPVVP